jgi:integrase
VQKLSDFFETTYRPLRLRGRSPNTSRLYGCTIRAFGRWLGRDPTLDDLDELTISRYLEFRTSSRSPYTAEKERTQLLSLARLAADRGLLRLRPCVPPAPLPDRIPTAYTVEQLSTLMRAAAETPGFVGPVPAGIWFVALLRVLWESAERIGAIMACTPDDFSAPRLFVRAEYRKGGKRDRFYTLSETTSRLVERVAGQKKIFEWHGSREYLWIRYKKITRRAGLDTGRDSGFHALRRAAASHYEAAGGDAAQLLDHSSNRITRRWYLDRRLTDRVTPPHEILPKIT